MKSGHPFQERARSFHVIEKNPLSVKIPFEYSAKLCIFNTLVPKRFVIITCIPLKKAMTMGRA